MGKLVEWPYQNISFLHEFLLLSLYQLHSSYIKLYVYKSWEKKVINVNNNLMAEIWKVRRIENKVTLTNSKKTIAFTKKWNIYNK